jgi:septal ring factor EnvC (AmiA/AmiB activator)
LDKKKFKEILFTLQGILYELMKKIFFALIVFFLFLTYSVSAQNKKSEQLKNSKKQIETEIANTNRLYNQTKKNKEVNLQQLTVLRKQISNREALITLLNKELLNLEEELEDNIKLSRSLDKKLEYMKADYSRVVYLAYKNRKMINKIAFLISAEDFTQMFRRFKYYSLFADNVAYQVEQIKQTREEIEKKNREILAIKHEKSNLLDNKEKEIVQLETDKSEKTRTTEELKKKEKQLENDLKIKTKKRNELDAAIKNAIQDEIAAANAKKAKEAKAKNKGKATAITSKSSSTTGYKTATETKSNKSNIVLSDEEIALSNSFVSNKGKLPWPVAKGVKTSDYGRYPHPDVPSVIIENKGVDILSENGTVVRTIFDGEVTGILDILGTKVLMIRHGEYLTVYQNIANIVVKKGDKVKTKQKIGSISKSQNNPGGELHFEVWQNNTNLNPNVWLAKP